MFVLVNLGGMLIALGCLAFSRYTLGLTSQFADNVSANVVGLILGTAFRYVMYRYVVFSPGSLERPAGEEAAGARAATRWQEPRERAAESVAPPSGP